MDGWMHDLFNKQQEIEMEEEDARGEANSCNSGVQNDSLDFG